MRIELLILYVEKIPMIDSLISIDDSFYQYYLPSKNSVTVENYLLPSGRIVNIYLTSNDKCDPVIKISMKKSNERLHYEYLYEDGALDVFSENYFALSEYKNCDKLFLVNFIKKHPDFLEWFMWNIFDKL